MILGTYGVVGYGTTHALAPYGRKLNVNKHTIIILLTGLLSVGCAKSSTIEAQVPTTTNRVASTGYQAFDQPGELVFEFSAPRTVVETRTTEVVKQSFGGVGSASRDQSLSVGRKSRP